MIKPGTIITYDDRGIFGLVVDYDWAMSVPHRTPDMGRRDQIVWALWTSDLKKVRHLKGGPENCAYLELKYVVIVSVPHTRNLPDWF